MLARSVDSLTGDWPPLPDLGDFHAAFRSQPDGTTPEGDIRQAFYLGRDSDNTEYLRLDDDELQHKLRDGRELIAACFVTPYPPGFPILVPGQVLGADMVTFLQTLDVKEIHGYRPELGLLVFTDEATNRLLNQNACNAGRRVTGEDIQQSVSALP